MSEVDQPSPLERSKHSIFPTAFCVIALLAVYVAIAWNAVERHSPIYDEPMHALASQIALRQHDYRIAIENPPLWDYLVALPARNVPLTIDPPRSQWASLPGNMMLEWPYMMRTMYRTPGNDPDAIIRRSRVVTLSLAVLCGIVIAAWAYRLAGPVAAVVSTALFSFDPNLLAHGPIVKNDVVVALIFAAGAMTTWSAGRSFKARHAFGLAAVCIAACTCKLSGLMLPPMLILLLGVRALWNEPWTMFGRSIATRGRRLGVVLVLGAMLLCSTVAGIWAVYGFRFSAIPDGTPLATGRLLGTINATWHASGHAGDPLEQPTLRVALWALQHRLMPEAYIDGIFYIYATTLDRPGFLLNEIRHQSWWYYYPLAAGFKFPLSTLLAAALALGVWWRVRRTPSRDRRWAVLCLAVPPVLYALAAMNQATAAGIRHLLPVFPALFIAIGCAAALMWTRRAMRAITVTLMCLLAVETAAGYPDYVAFFNVAAGGSRNGINLLASTNLDSGQDLPALANWRHDHPEGDLYLSYSGSVDPAHYGIVYRNLPGGYLLGPPVVWPPGPGYVAVCAGNLQGVDSSPSNNYGPLLAPLRKLTPIAVLGGTIYVYSIR